MQKLEPPKDKGANAGESGPLPVHIEKARIEHAQVRMCFISVCTSAL